MGWESFRSEWDEPVDDKKGKLSWWDQFQSDKVDEPGGDDETDMFSYRSAFDDSDKSWYRQSSFRYGGYRDYSPSSLFRSSFSGWRSFSTRSSDNEAKNKAIRALRTLTRNANTIADAAKKIKYAVQFSSGADSNGSAAEISTGKEQTIFVSPDTVVSAKEQNEEDAAIDALTGFVLLRVQLSQAVTAGVIRDINACGLRAIPARLAATLCSATGAISAAELAAEVVDNYSASMLAKSMLTRLCRRAVVEDWGGFAPYFVRHAKKFATTREKLEAAELSPETLAAKIAYNMIAAEDELPIAPEIAAIAAKHLGEKVEQAAILPACKTLVAELRAYLASMSPDASATPGEFETSLIEGLQEILEERQADSTGSPKKEEAALADSLEDLASLFDALHMQNLDSAPDATAASLLEKKKSEIIEIKFKEKLISAFKKIAKDLTVAAELPNLTDSNLYYPNRSLEQNIKHFDRQYREMLAAANAAGKTLKEIDAPNYAGMTLEEKARAMAADINALVDAFKPQVKNALAKIKAEAIAAVNETLKKLPDVKNKLNQLAAMAANCRDKLRTAVNVFDSAKPISAVAEVAAATMQDKIRELNLFEEKLKSDVLGGKSAIAKNSASLQQFCELAKNELQRGVGACHNVLNSMSWSHDAACRSFVRAAIDAGNELYSNNGPEIADWHEPAIDDYISSKLETGDEVASGAMATAHKELFEELRELLRNKDSGNVPKKVNSVPKDAQARLKNAAESLGLSPQELLNMLNADDARRSTGNQSKTADKLGRAITEEMLTMAAAISPVDDELFGGKIENGTTILDGKSIGHVNDEARNVAEEDYVAYLSHDETKPVIKLQKQKRETDPHAKNIVKRIQTQQRGAIERIRNALQFQNTKRTGEIYGTRSGDLDEGSLHKLGYDSEHIWTQKTITKLPDVAVGILVDQSGSMSSSNKIAQAREMCILLAEAVKKVEGVHLHIYGHTANRGGGNDLQLFEHYSSTGSASNADLSGLGSITSFSNNYDGYAIKETAKLLNNDPAKRKYLFVISDGLPHGNGYSGEQARKHVASVCSFVRTRLKIATYAFAVGVSDYDSDSRKEFEEQYGADKMMFLSTVSQCLPQIVRFLRNALQKEKNLVDVGVD
jgi:nitric oxide reductase activation protein